MMYWKFGRLYVDRACPVLTNASMTGERGGKEAQSKGEGSS
jgi:hypothetical protein